VSHTWLRVDGEVRAIAPDDAGGWYVGGTFSAVNGLARNRIAHLLPNGDVDPAWNPGANEAVFALAVSGGTVYAGGEFTMMRGLLRGYFAAFEP
jgi:hypothetical protein